MATTRKKSNQDESPRRPPATTPEAREQQLVALAYDEVERKIRAGEASSQELTHFLKMGSSREKREQRRIELEADLAMKKLETIESVKRVEELYEGAIQAMRSYSGQQEPGQDDNYEE